MVFSEFLNRIRVVFHIDIDPHQSGNTEDVYEVDQHEHDQQTECHVGAIAKSPLKSGYEKDRKPAGPDIGHEHSAIVVARLREVIQVAFWAALQHVEGLHERPAARFKHFPFMTTRTFEVEYAVEFGTLLENVGHNVWMKRVWFFVFHVLFSLNAFGKRKTNTIESYVANVLPWRVKCPCL